MLSQPISRAVAPWQFDLALVGIVRCATDTGLPPTHIRVCVSGCACKYQLSIDAVLHGLMACIRCHNLMACATSRVHAYLRGGHHQAHALLGVALFLYDGGGAVQEGINGRGGLRLRLLPSADAHHALITCCSSNRESLSPAHIAILAARKAMAGKAACQVCAAVSNTE